LATAQEGTIIVLDAQTGRPWHVLEVYPEPVRALSFSADGKYFASRAGYTGEPGLEAGQGDGRLLVFETASLKVVETIEVTCGRYIFTGLAFSPSGPLLATSAEQDRAVQIWKLDPHALRPKSTRTPSIHYKNAKVALVGDSGVGKSGLALVLTGHRFEATESTHGRRVLAFAAERVQSKAGPPEIRETVLWDLAGQPGYRLIHQLHLSDVTVGLVLFDSRNELDPFSGAQHWSRALSHAVGLATKLPPRVILVAARTDRGPVAVGGERIRSMVAQLGAHSYVETSAKEGLGIRELRTQISNAIRWDAVPTVSSSVLFQGIRKFLTNQGSAGTVLATVDDLLRAFNGSDRDGRGRRRAPRLSRRVFEGCVQRLQSLGLIRRFSFGDLVLLQPERLDAYASSIIFAAQQEPDGMGSIPERLVLAGGVPIPAADKLPKGAEERLLLMAVIEDMVAHEIAFREPGEDGQLLVFPSQLTRENPDLPDPEGRDLRIDFIGLF
jgi:GTPase SAR1 family protein